MSLVHTIVFRQMMKSKVLYSPDCKIDYDKKRQEERRQTGRIPLLKDVAMKEGNLGVDLCQYFGQKKLKDYAAFFSSSSSFC